MVYDVFPFFNEFDILKIRLNILSPLVDRFVIGEATHTFSGLPKELNFAANREMFADFLPRIEYIVIDDSPPELKPHSRDRYQKNQLLRGLKEANEEDVIIFSDLDEIPNPVVLKDIIENFDPDKIYHLAQRTFHGYLNREEITGKLLSMSGEFAGVKIPKCLGTKVFSMKNLPEKGISAIREVDLSLAHNLRIDNGGWHFSYMGGSGVKNLSKRVTEKIKAAAHQEYNESHTLAEISARTKLGKDILGSDAEFALVPIDESFPGYLRENLNEYEHLVMPEVTRGQAHIIKALMLVRRFFRRVYLRLKRFIKTGKILNDKVPETEES